MGTYCINEWRSKSPTWLASEVSEVTVLHTAEIPLALGKVAKCLTPNVQFSDISKFPNNTAQIWRQEVSVSVCLLFGNRRNACRVKSFRALCCLKVIDAVVGVVHVSGRSTRSLLGSYICLFVFERRPLSQLHG